MCMLTLFVMTIILSISAVQLVQRKFEYPVGGDVNYPAFIQCIDEEYRGQVVVEGRERERGQQERYVYECLSKCRGEEEGCSVLLFLSQQHSVLCEW